MAHLAWSLGILVLAAGWPFGRPASAQSRAIADNSFLLEEAYNQEAGVVQHISVWQRSLISAAWTFTFTQEWPLGGQRHQLSYTVPIQRLANPAGASGVGDVAVNYRYQMFPADQRVALAPRLSMFLPTGEESRGLGAGAIGVQLNVPLSVTLGSALVTHWNAGATAVSRATTYNLGASAIWLMRPSFNVLLELAWADGNAGAESFVVNPGIRWAHNFASGLQIVPGIAIPDGESVLLYLSFEHRFKSVRGPVNSIVGPP